MSYRKCRRTRGSSNASQVAPISRFFQDTTYSAPAASLEATRGGRGTAASLSASMAASQYSMPNSLAGLPSLLDPSPSTPSSLGASALISQADADIRALIRALPMKVDMEALVMRVKEQHRRNFQELRSEVHVLDDRPSKEESEVSALELWVTQLERDHTSFQDQLVGVQLHVEDLENWTTIYGSSGCLRRQALRTCRIPSRRSSIRS